MNNKLTSTKEINAIFLAIVLVIGTIALSYPSFIIIGEAQSQPYYGMDSYGSSEYGNDNGYDKSQYQSSYEPDYYKPQYPSYGKDNRDKSKDSSKSVDIKKINCINTNININGNNTGDINLGNKGQVAAEGYLAGYSSDGSGYGSEGYYDGNYKKDKGITCIINNNNNNTNIVAGGGGNVTEQNTTLAVTKTVTCTPNDTSPQANATCQFIQSNVLPSSFNITVIGNNPNPSQFPGSNDPVVVNLGAGNYEVTEEAPFVVPPIAGVSIVINTSFAGDCTDVSPNDPQSTEATGTIEAGESQTCDIRNDYRPFFITPPGGLIASNINTADLTPSFSSPSTIVQETGDSSEALAKITKLKQQWLDLLP